MEEARYMQTIKGSFSLCLWCANKLCLNRELTLFAQVRNQKGTSVAEILIKQPYFLRFQANLRPPIGVPFNPL